jgi:hypothetical protein
MSLTTVACGVVKGLRMSCGLFLVVAATSAAVQAGGPIPNAVPEIDPGSMSGALAMLASGAFLVRGWCRRK